jgi:hypothetical protein
LNFDFYSLFELSQIKAIQSALDPSLDSIWRMRCRDYSVKFHTPLHTVINDLDPIFVLQQLNEDRYHPSVVEEELEELLETIYKIKDPTHSKMSDQETEDLVDAVLNREIQRLAKKKAPTQETIKAEIKQAESKPKSGGMTFGDLEKMESKAEVNKAGF